MSRQPIAITGMACRFPGGCRNPEDFWRLLSAGADAVTSVGNDRWPTEYYYHPERSRPGRTVSTAAGQIDNVFDFDAAFFGISPREAVQMDPQQRLLLELTWEALEDGGQLPEQLAGTDCSVFVGTSATDYANARYDDPSLADGYFMTGNTLSIVANRISYQFDLRGPSMAVDTACSSSLVALHQACSSIWHGESPFSIVGTAHLLLSPFPFIGFSKANMLAADGRCRVFDRDGSGYVRSEGGAVLFLKPLADALADGDPVHAVIRATAVNTDGRKSALTVPASDAQARLLENVYVQAGIHPERISYLEAHGTGTPVGDPVEAAAIGAAIGARRAPGQPLNIGSVKSNLGHLEPASGFAGLFKVILSLKHRGIPATLHCREINPAIDCPALNINIVREFTPLEQSADPLIMGVNSFGFGGSNAHVIIEEFREPSAPRLPAPPPSAATEPGRGLPPLFLSAGSDAALRRRAQQFAALLEEAADPDAVLDIFHTSARRRARLRHRLAAFAGQRSRIVGDLRAYAAGEQPEAVAAVESDIESAGVVFVFSGNGAQWPGMARALLADPAFRDSIREIDVEFRDLAGWSLLAELEAEASGGRLALTEVAQPLLFAVQVALVRFYETLGVKPAAVFGHSVGEIAAAWAAGALTLREAVKVIFHRSAVQGRTRGMGRMAAVRLSPDGARERLEQYGGAVELAAVNSPNSVTLTGDGEALVELARALEREETFVRLLDLDYAFHSRVLDPLAADFRGAIGTVRSSPCAVEFLSTVTGGALPGTALDSNYWWQNIRRPVQFAAAAGAALDRGHRLFVEIGPHPILQTYLRECLRERRHGARVLQSMNRRDAEPLQRLRSAAHEALLLHPQPALDRLYPGGRRCAALPGYPWDHEYYRTTATPEVVNRRREHPLLGCKSFQVAGVWQSQIDLQTHPYLADHRVDGLAILPAAGFADMALAAARSHLGLESCEIIDLEIRKPLVLDEETTRDVELRVHSGTLRFAIRSRPRLSTGAWSEHVTGQFIAEAPGIPLTRPAGVAAGLATAAGETCEADAIYETAEAMGLSYGPVFRSLARVRFGDDSRLHGDIELSPAARGMADGFVIHPAALDAAFHMLFPLLARNCRNAAEPDGSFLPVRFGALRLYLPGAGIARALCSINRHSARALTATFRLEDADGKLVAELKECVFKKLPRNTERGPAVYRYRRVPAERRSGARYATVISMGEVIETVRAQRGASADDGQAARRQERQALSEALSVALAEQALGEIGIGDGRFRIEDLIESDTIVPEQRPYLRWLLNLLECSGRVTHEGEQWVRERELPPDDPVPIWRALLADHPAQVTEMVRVAARGFNLTDYLRGSRTANGDGSQFAAPDDLLAVVVHAIEQVRQRWPTTRRRLRLAWFVGRAADISSQIPGHLPREFCDVTVIAGDADCLLRARQQFRAFANVSVLEESPVARGQAEDMDQAGFDIVIAHAWLHRSPDPVSTLQDLRRRLAPEGLLLLCEPVPDELNDLIEGVRPDWWTAPADGGPPVSRLMDADAWLMLLGRADFRDATVVLDADAENLHSNIIAARRPVASASVEPAGAGTPGRWLLLADRAEDSLGLALQVREKLMSAGHAVQVALDAPQGSAEADLYYDADGEASCTTMIGAALGAGNVVPDILHLSGIRFDGIAGDADPVADQVRRCMGLRHIVTALERNLGEQRVALWLVCSGSSTTGRVVADRALQVDPGQAALWGFGRVIRNEFPWLDTRLVKLQGSSSRHRAAMLLAEEVEEPDDEKEVILSDAGRWGVRIDRDSSALPAAEAGAASRYVLALDRPGAPEHLYWRELAARTPGPGEVEIRVQATGLNFRDVMFAAGALPEEMLEDGFAGPTLGMECSGVVTAVGPGVRDFTPGSEVVAFAPACFASHVVTRATTVARKPADWTFEEAATIPTAFFTVYYALGHLARLAPGERILIHGAAGGVGLAAIQYARHCGAEIFATAGSDEKRRLLELLGVEHVLDSRSLQFTERIRALTDGQGVDVVLNSLAGAAMERSLAVLRPFGRFIELGKRDFFENTTVGLRPFRHNVSYFGVDADQLFAQQPSLATRLFREVIALFDGGAFRPLPHIVHFAADVDGAFRRMQQARHVGKIVVSMHAPPPAIRRLPVAAGQLQLDGHGAYLVSGGLGGFGLATACRLADRGARFLVLISRRGIPGEEEAQLIESLRARGVEVMVRACDVTDPAALKSVFEEIDRAGRPLRGVVHAAMVIDDHTLRNLTTEAFRRVMEPKVRGAWNLHRLSRDRELQFFILYSSATVCFGSPGQGNYVAANAVLEALAAWRRGLGLPALAVALDAIADAGYLARSPELQERFRHRYGTNGVSSARALDLIEQELAAASDHALIMNPDWRALRRMLPDATAPQFEWMIHGAGEADAPGTAEDLRAQLAVLSVEEQHVLLADLLCEEISRIMHLAAEKIDRNRALQDLGVDSLMAMELATAIESRFGVDLPLMALADNANIDALAARLREMLQPDSGADDGGRADTVSALARAHAVDVPEEEIEELIQEVRRSGSGTRRLIQ
jgi:phthiocerol/phenolphthiocerol synthesis type-I polyketide synthase C